MSRLIRGQEFANRSADSRYPLIPAATALDQTGEFQIPNDLLAGLYLAIPADIGMSPGTFWVRRIINAGIRCSIVIGAQAAGGPVTLGQFDILRDLITTQLQDYGYGFTTFSPAAAYGDFRGRLLVGGLDSLATQPQGTFEFDYIGSGLSVDCIRPMLQRVTAVEVVNQAGKTFRLSGTIRLRGGDNANLSIITEDGQPVIVLDAVDGSQLNDQMQCDQQGGTIIRKINGLPGNSLGEVNLLGSNCLTVQPQQMGLQLLNACSEPCASCEESQALKNLVDPFVTQVPTLMNLANRLDLMVTQLQFNLSAKTDACGTEENPCAGQEAENKAQQGSDIAYRWFRRNF